jgi:hypothetical protein
MSTGNNHPTIADSQKCPTQLGSCGDNAHSLHRFVSDLPEEGTQWVKGDRMKSVDEVDTHAVVVGNFVRDRAFRGYRWGWTRNTLMTHEQWWRWVKGAHVANSD